MNIAKDTKEIIALFEAGWTVDELCQKFKIERTTIIRRLKRWGFDCSPPNKYTTLDRERLELLYRSEKNLCQIAAEFAVSVWTLKSALCFYRLPLRLPRQTIDTPANRAAILKAIEDFEGGATWKEIAARRGVSPLTIRNRIRACGIPLPRAKRHIRARTKPLYSGEEKTQLEDLYLVKKLPINEIMRRLGFSRSTIDKALEFHGLKNRLPFAAHIEKFRKLTVGETIIVKTNAKYPVTNLHTISKKVPIKISVRRDGEGNFKVTRVE